MGHHAALGEGIAPACRRSDPRCAADALERAQARRRTRGGLAARRASRRYREGRAQGVPRDLRGERVRIKSGTLVSSASALRLFRRETLRALAKPDVTASVKENLEEFSLSPESK